MPCSFVCFQPSRTIKTHFWCRSEHCILPSDFILHILYCYNPAFWLQYHNEHWFDLMSTRVYLCDWLDIHRRNDVYVECCCSTVSSVRVSSLAPIHCMTLLWVRWAVLRSYPACITSFRRVLSRWLTFSATTFHRALSACSMLSPTSRGITRTFVSQLFCLCVAHFTTFWLLHHQTAFWLRDYYIPRHRWHAQDWGW